MAMQLSPEPMRYVHLIRHGQYVRDEESGDGPLSMLGRKQAVAAGRYLVRWPIEKVWSSDMQRAIETAELIVHRLEGVESATSPLLREVVPTAIPGQSVPLALRRHARQAIDRVTTTFFQPVRATRHELLVCHGNLIRSLVCRVLRTPEASWLRLATYHCALTTVAVSSDGETRLVRYGESAYLDDELFTNQ
jgi:serine/threonine-protein phosphatase PGAM5